MRRLTIGWCGTSKALGAIRPVLEQYGHVSGEKSVDLWIEDGSLPLPDDVGKAICISLRLGVGPVTDCGLPTLQLRVYDREKRLSAVLDITEEHSGNGQRLRRQVTDTLVDWVALLVSGFSRDPGALSTSAIATEWPEQSLRGLETLAFMHRLNRTADPDLLRKAQVSVIEQVQSSLHAFAHRPALSIAGHTVTYRELHLQAIAIQQRLKPLLDAVETPWIVGVCMEKSIELYASILALLGCGAVYLPLESEQPLKRHQAMLESAGAQVLLDTGQHPLRERFTSLDVSTVEPYNTQSAHPLMHLRPCSDMPCMVLYTSGSTGQPKGVLLSQGNLAHFTAWFGSCMKQDERSRVLQFSPLGFDSSLIDIFPALIAGAQLIVPSEEQRRDPEQLVELLRRQCVTHAFLPPALLNILPLNQPLGVHLLTGGDACEPHVVERLAEQCQLHNLYGPTETTVLITHRTFAPDDNNRNVGRPIANSQVLILDDDLQPVDEQVMGELYIVGPGVSLGYVNAPNQADSPFVELLMPSGQTLRAYRSGDLAMWTADGILLGGRRDDQVKIRGFRVEPREIEQCLRNSRLYRELAVVIDHENRICSFVAQPRPGATLVALQQHARHWLPDYMQPGFWVELPGMPYSNNGKVDRKTLLALPFQPIFKAAHSAAVHTPLQAQLSAVWAELLGLPANQLSIDESFFALGGHSILLSTLLLRIREQFGRSFALSHFIEVPTIRTLAILMEDGERPDASSEQAVLDAQREWEINPLHEDRAGDPRKVIVTGANSFVGVHIVEALLASDVAEVACLVRELPGQPAMARFTKALREFRLAHLDLSRVRVLAADISLPQLGLTRSAYDSLAADFGVLVHNAAQVNHVTDYASLARDNVEPIFECLRLCETRCKKVFNFVSTLSASSSIDAHGHVLEAPAAATLPLYIRNGYNLSKWAAERVLGRAAAQGAWVNIHRPGNISFNSRNGVCQPQKNRLMLMLKGSLQLGMLPRLDLNFDLMPVDFLARFIAYHCTRFQADRRVFNLHNPQPLSWDHYVDAFSRAGHGFERVSTARWQQALRTVGQDNALFGVLGFYLGRLDEDISDTLMIRHDNARQGVQEMGEQYPDKDPALLSKGCNYLKTIGFL